MCDNSAGLHAAAEGVSAEAPSACVPLYSSPDGVRIGCAPTCACLPYRAPWVAIFEVQRPAAFSTHTHVPAIESPARSRPWLLYLDGGNGACALLHTVIGARRSSAMPETVYTAQHTGPFATAAALLCGRRARKCARTAASQRCLWAATQRQRL
jgi:hypothetical protein